MTPDDIRTQRFGTRLLRGLSPEEVSAFLEDVADAYANLLATNTSLTERVKALEEPPASSHIETLRTTVLQEVEALLRDARVQVQVLLGGAREREAEMLREAEATRARMQREAEELVTEATRSAEALVHDAREQEATARREIDRLTQSRLQLVDEIRGSLDSYQQWLATVDPRGRARGRREVHEASETSGNGAGATDEARAG
jgi:DivIVA domain-containing protein